MALCKERRCVCVCERERVRERVYKEQYSITGVQGSTVQGGEGGGFVSNDKIIFPRRSVVDH
jgi:hypothetical protein